MNGRTITCLALLLAASAFGQASKPTFVRGTMDIKYGTRTGAAAGELDTYALKLNVSDSVVFGGRLEYTPLVVGFLGRVSQGASLAYKLDCDVVNPANPAQTKTIGHVTGSVPIATDGTYDYSAGNVDVSVYAIGRAPAFDSRVVGKTKGKPLLKSDSLLERARNTVVNMTKQVGGKTFSLAVTNYDVMKFSGFKLAAGPVQYYPEVTVNGTMVYDYDRSVWYFRNVTMAYAEDGKQLVDKLTGNIRWTEKPRVGASREGEYQFDVRVNEPPPSEASAFASASDESAFFQTDDTIPTLGGTMRYADTFGGAGGDSVVASAVKVDLSGNRLTRQQCMNLTKLLVMACVVPLNAE